VQFDVEFDDRPERKFLHDDAVGPGWKVRNVVQTFPLVSPLNVTLVSTFVASTFTPPMTPPPGSVTRPVSVAVGSAKSGLVTDK
jgi:hypothetical protein